MKNLTKPVGDLYPHIKKLLLIMRLSVLLILIAVFTSTASVYSQATKLTIKMENARLSEVFDAIEKQSEFYFFYNRDYFNDDRIISVDVENKLVDEVLKELLQGEAITWEIFDRNILLRIPEAPLTNAQQEVMQQQRTVSGKVTDSFGQPLPGVTIVVKGSTQGTVSNVEGNYSLANISEDATLVFSFVGMKTKEIIVGNQIYLNIQMEEETIGLEEVVAIGYGTMKKSDLTGSLINADFDKFRDQPNISIAQSLQGSVAGLNVSQVSQAGEEPIISIRGRTSISGEQKPLIVLDGVIFRGNIIDINPDDIGMINVLKDNSSTAIYGSQAANGVILITSKTGKGKNMKPLINYSGSYSFQAPTVEFKPGDGSDFIRKNYDIDWLESRTPESGYIEPRPDWTVSALFKSNAQVDNYIAGKEANWFDLMTNDNSYIQNHNLSLMNNTEYLNYFISIGYTDQQGYMINENYKRYNARINIDNNITNWLAIGTQAFFSMSDYSGQSPEPSHRFITPYETAYNEDGTIDPLIENLSVSPLAIAEADEMDVRNNLFANIYANIDIPFIEGLSYKVNFSNNYMTTRNYYYQPYSHNFQGEGGKSYGNSHDFSSDNILTFNRRFRETQNLNITLLYGFEQRKHDFTDAISSVFINDILGYNSLQSGNSENQKTYSGAWEEKSLYSMARFFYSLFDKYLITGTIRRDGFSGFSTNNKFGIFPSAALGWVISEESFFPETDNVINYLKFRISYGTIGNRTVGRYQTLAKVDGDFRYVDASGTSVYAKSISSLASSNLKWETTTGFNCGLDFRFFSSRLSGAIEYYNNNTKDLLYEVDIPSIGRFNKFPDNLGKIHNHGIEITFSSININANAFRWVSDFSFARNRDELKELLGFDNDGDGKEDDLISEGLFIGHPLSAVYHYEVSGELYQFSDEVPPTAVVGSYVIVDQNGDGTINPENDKKILGYKEPSYRFSITNQFKYKNWSLSFFINSVQGGEKYYYAMDNLHGLNQGSPFSNSVGGEQHFQFNFPKNLDFWLPENPDAKYERIGAGLSHNLLSTLWSQRSFIRLQDISLNYDFGAHFLNDIKINNLKFFVSGKNLFTWTKWPGWDPETGEGINRQGRPVMRSYTLGINLEF